jgi:hypothetical protein
MSDTPKAAPEIRKSRCRGRLRRSGVVPSCLGQGLGPGHVAETVTGDEARRHIDELSRKYTGHDYAAPVGPHGRVILKVVPDKVNIPRLLAH